MPFTLPELPYAYDALEPYIDAKTMEIHHTKHHQAYTDKLNAALENQPELASKDIADILLTITSVPDDIRTAVRNHGGGYANHNLFWTVMGPASAKASAGKPQSSGGKPNGDLAAAIDEAFGDYQAFVDTFTEAATTRFGSGWAWLVVRDGKLAVGSTANQDSPLMGEEVAGLAGTPILGLDVWEHAYYLKYQNKRPDYIEAFWTIVNWPEVERRYAEAQT